MNQNQLIEEVRGILAKAGFYLSERHYERGISFDLIARRDDHLLIIGILLNADSSRIENAKEMKILADVLDGSPMLIALSGGRRPLQRGVVYSRKGIPLISLDTLNDMFIEGVPPYVFSAPGGFYVSIDSDLLREARKERQISLRKMAEIAGVSRKAIQKYEEGMGVDLEVAMRMEEYLGKDLILPLDPLDHDEELKGTVMNPLEEFTGVQKIIFKSLVSMGYEVVPTRRSPFEAITSDESTILLSGVGSHSERKLKKKARVVSNLSHITEKDSVIFMKSRRTHYNIEGTPLIDRRELEYLTSRDDMIDLLRERKSGGV